MAWVTRLPFTKDSVAEIAPCGRARWKIRSESYNVMKNHGCEPDRNFVHGSKVLATTLAALDLLAFARRIVREIIEPP
jgi:hypothetical protein